MEIASHMGTHVDAPLHYGTKCEGKPSRTISDIDLNELFVDAMVLDLRGTTGPGEGITVASLDAAIKANGAPVTPGCALLLRTGQERYDLSQEGFFRYPGMTRRGTLHLADMGAKILGTDALGWDRPIGMMKAVFQKTRDPGDIWDGHYAGRDREVFIVQQMVNLASLPPNGSRWRSSRCAWPAAAPPRPASSPSCPEARMTTDPTPARRIVTGDGPDGLSRIVSDGPAPISRTVPERPGYLVSNLWTMKLSDGPQGEDRTAALPGILPPSGGSVLRVIDFPPEGDDPVARERGMAATFAGIFADADHRGGKHPGMHVTRTVDYAIILAGEIWAILDAEETLMRAGDILVQRGTSHAWANRSKASARIAFILIDTP